MEPLLTDRMVRVNLGRWPPIHQRGLCRRATQVYTISETQTDDPPTGAERFVLKAYWPEAGTRSPEHQVIRDPDGLRDGTAFATSHTRTALAVKPISPRRHVLRFIASEELYRLQDQPTSEIEMSMVLEAVQYHYALWVKNVHHMDISLDNIMVWRNRTPGDDAPRLSAVINDWDLASNPDSSHAVLERTGTIPFMHPELLTDAFWEGKVPRLYVHDNASFIWVLAFLFLRYSKGKIIDSPHLPLDDLLTNDYTMARRIKIDMRYTIDELVCGVDAEKEWEVVVGLLHWSRMNDNIRVDAKYIVRKDPIKLEQLLNTDDAPGVYKAFWDTIKEGAVAQGLDYILRMVPVTKDPGWVC